MAWHIQEKLKSLIHEVQHAIQVREGFAVGADVVFWENSKSNEYGDANIDEYMGIRYNDDIDIPYRKKNNLMNMLYRQTTEQIN